MTIVFAAHGIRFVLDPDHHPAGRAIADVLCDLVVDEPSGNLPMLHVESLPPGTQDEPRPMVSVALGDELIVPWVVEGSVLSHLLIELNRRAAASVPLAVHASTVLIDGVTVVLAGASHSGKTTLATMAACVGGDLIADEVSALTPETLHVARYGKPVALRPDSVDLLRSHVARLARPGSPFEDDERFVPPSELGTISAAPPPVGAIVFPSFSSGAGCDLVPVSPASALVSLMAAVMAQGPDPAEHFRTLERLVRSAPAATLDYGDAEAAIHRLRASLST